jgi:hypothetical protein
VTREGLDDYYNGNAKILKYDIKTTHKVRSWVRRKNPFLIKMLNLFFIEDFVLPRTTRSLANSLNVSITRVYDTLKHDTSSKTPYFRRIKYEDHSPSKFTPTDAGYKAWFNWKREEANDGE